MILYGNYKPSVFDKNYPIPNRKDWYVSSISINRDSNLSYTSNWDTQIDLIEKECGEEDEENGWEIHRFGHWACGWFEILLVKPNSKAFETVKEIEEKVEYYPLLDDEHYSTLVFNAMIKDWESSNIRQRIEYCKKAGISIFAARRNELPEGIESDHMGIE